jgi:hypothetical protein
MLSSKFTKSILYIEGKWEGDIDALYSKVYSEQQRCPDVPLMDGRK